MPAAERPPLSEEDRIRSAYSHYSTEGRASRWGPSDPVNGLIHAERRGALSGLMGSALGDEALPLILDVGCGSGRSMLDWNELGVGAERLFGVDLLLDRLSGVDEKVRGKCSAASAANLPFRDGTFQIVSTFTVFSSIRSDRLQEVVARELERVLRPSGRIVCYDMRLPNPSNREIRHISLGRLRRLFPRGEFESRTLTLLPPLARRLQVSKESYRRLASIKLLRSHRLTTVSFPYGPA